MKKLLCLAGGAAALAGYYLYHIAPNTGRKEQMRPFEEQYIAHRGLFHPDAGIPENSLPAFRRAVEAGHGIELDVQMTTDHRLVVFHDDNLKRMCGVDRRLTDFCWNDLKKLKLSNSEERIPLLNEVLSVIDGRVPLIVEIKPRGPWLETTRRVARRMDRYSGLYCMESFHPLAVAWYRKNRPHVIRGQLAKDFLHSGDKMVLPGKILLANMLLNNYARPDFIAYDFRDADQPTFRLMRKLFPAEYVAWTVKSQEELTQAKKDFDVILFDSFIPD